MLSQNVKGLLTLILVFSLVGGSLYLYKVVIEPKISSTENTISTLPVDISNYQKEIIPKIEVFSTNAKVTFNTPTESLGAVKFCLKNSINSCNTIAEEKLRKDHLIELVNLKSTTDYDYKIVIDGTEYPEGDSYFSFKTANEKNSIENVKASFEKAIQSQDLTFDYNNDKRVTILDFRKYQQENN